MTQNVCQTESGVQTSPRCYPLADEAVVFCFTRGSDIPTAAFQPGSDALAEDALRVYFVFRFSLDLNDLYRLRLRRLPRLLQHRSCRHIFHGLRVVCLPPIPVQNESYLWC